MAKIPAVTQYSITRTLLGGYVVNYHCPHCHRQLTSKESEIGQRAECPKCGNSYGVSRKALTAIYAARAAKADADRKNKEVKDAKKPKCMVCGAPRTFMDPLVEREDGFLCDEHYSERLAKERQERKLQQQLTLEHIERQAEQVIATTSPTIEGFRIVEYVGIDGVELTVGTGIFADFGIAIKDVFGARSRMQESKLRKGRLEAIRLFKFLAAQEGANGIISVDIDYSEFGHNQTAIMVNGTLVRIEQVVDIETE